MVFVEGLSLGGKTLHYDPDLRFCKTHYSRIAYPIPPIEYTLLRNDFGSGVERDGETFIVGDNEYFVLGDISKVSADSRAWGNVPAGSIFGKVTKIYSPPSRWGWTE